MKTIHLAGPSITEHEIKIVEDALRNGWYEKAYYYCEKFETEFAGYHGRKFALMTPNCTSAIHLLLAGLGISDGDEVIVPECTWIATAAPIKHLRAKTVFADIDPVHWCLDPKSVEKHITPKTKAIIVVDLYGNMPDMDALLEISKKYKIPLIEDAAEALGSRYKNIRAGKFGIGSVFSFHRTKTITTGEGGMLLLDDEALFERCKFLRDHGRVQGRPYYNSEVAFKYMPSNIQAALGWAQFQRIDELVGKKRQFMLLYKQKLAGIEDIQLNDEPAWVYNGAWATALVFGKSHGITKERAMKELESKGIPPRPFYYPLSSLPAYACADTQENEKKNPVAYDLSSRGIHLAGALDLTEDQIDFICRGIRNMLGRN